MTTTATASRRLSFDDLDGAETIDVITAARLLGVGRNAAYAAVERGELPSIRLGGRILIPVARLRALVEGDGGGR